MTIKEEENLINEALAYWEESKTLGQDTSRSEIITRESYLNFRKLLGTLIESDIKLLKKDFRYLPKRSTISLIKSFYHELFNGKYDKEIDKYIKITRANFFLGKYDAKMTCITDYDNKINIPEKLKIYSMRKMISPILHVHEDMHGLYEMNGVRPNSNINHEEILPILIELIMTHLICEKYPEEDKKNYYIVRYNNTASAAFEYVNYKSFIAPSSPERKKELEEADVKNIILNKNYAYIIGGIFAERLLEIYQDKPEQIIKGIDNIIQHNETIPEFLDRYDVNLTNQNTIGAFQKTIGSIGGYNESNRSIF